MTAVTDYLGDIFHGLSVNIGTPDAQPVHLPSTSTIGLVDEYVPGSGLVAADTPTLITNYSEAVVAFGASSKIAASCKSIFEQTSAAVVCIGVAHNSDAAAQTSAIIGTDNGTTRTGLLALLDAKHRLDLKPRLILAPTHSSTVAVAAEMAIVAEKLRAISIVDGPGTSHTAATTYATTISGSKRHYLIDPGIKRWNAATSTTDTVAASPYAAALFAQTDAKIGWWASPSNKPILGITGTGRPVEFIDNDPNCRANLLNRAGVTTIIRDGAYRLWGNRTLADDPNWSFVTRVRIMDFIVDALLTAGKTLVDLPLNRAFAKELNTTLDHFMRDLKTKGAVLGFEIYLDPALNTASQLYDYGRLYYNVRFTDPPPAENPVITLGNTDQWVTEVLNIGG